jgi:hypothetical protein
MGYHDPRISLEGSWPLTRYCPVHFGLERILFLIQEPKCSPRAPKGKNYSKDPPSITIDHLSLDYLNVCHASA